MSFKLGVILGDFSMCLQLWMFLCRVRSLGLGPFFFLRDLTGMYSISLPSSVVCIVVSMGFLLLFLWVLQ